eukprot:jgi/Mesen1/7979/ME000425S07181
MGCFTFGKRKVPDNRSPEHSSTQLKPRPGSSDISPKSTSPDRVKEGSTLGGRPMPLPSPVRQLPLHPTKKGPLKTISEKGILPNSGDSVRGSSNSSESSSPRVVPKTGETRATEKMARASSLCKKQSALRPFRLSELEGMTKDFAIEGFLGEGGFGPVFKGYMPDPDRSGKQVAVAVKVLNTDGHQGEKEWTTEVDFLGLLHHPNLVNLIGYCAEDDQRLLVYEFLSNRSLEHALFLRNPGDPPLSWNRRVKIALGAARGLAYLHEEADHQVIYRDFKTSNILLSGEWEAKLSDFGLARSGPEGDESHVSTRIVGTVGYAAPEYVMTGHLTTKSDVWGFGVVLLELLTGRLAMDKRRAHDEQSLVEWAEPYLENPCKLYKIMDPELNGRYSVRGVQLAATVIQKCLKKKAKLRPKMTEVVEALSPIQDLHDMAGFTMDDLRHSVKRRSEMKDKRRPGGLDTSNSSRGPPSAVPAGAS